MLESEMNPWKVGDFNHFIHFECPECNFKAKSTNKFIQHGIQNHLENFKAAYTGIGVPKTKVYFCKFCLEIDFKKVKCCGGETKIIGQVSH